MSFVYPGFLFALFALLIPIIVHLFNFRRFKKVYFTNVRFLREIQQDTRNRSRLKHLLILASRLLAVLFLVLAFAQPFLPATGSRVTAGIRKVSVYLDNSFSMDAISNNGDLLEVAKRKAREIAMGYQPSDQFQLLTNSFDGRSQRMMSREEFLDQVDAVRRGSDSRLVSEILVRQSDALEAGNGGAGIQYLISDFQKSMSDVSTLRPDSQDEAFFVPVASQKKGNVYIDTCYFTQPYIQLNAANELLIRVRNSGEEDAENVPVSLAIGGVQRSVTSVNVGAGSSADARLSFTLQQGGWMEARISLTDYPVVFDDQYYFSFRVRQYLQVLAIHEQGSNPYLDALFANDPYFRLDHAGASQVDYSSLHSRQLILLDGVKNISSGMAGELKKYVEQGGTLAVFPAPDADLTSYRDFLKACNSPSYQPLVRAEENVTRLETDHPLLSAVFENKRALPENMDLPRVHAWFPFDRPVSESVMTMGNGQSLLAASTAGRGQLYLASVPLDEEYSNLPHHALFVPIILRMALRSASEAAAPMIIGRDRDIIIRDTVLSGDQVFHLKNEALGFDIVPEGRILENTSAVSVHDQVKEAGNYSLLAGNRPVALVSFNYDRKESNLDCYSPEELETLLEKSGRNFRMIEPAKADLSHIISELNEGKRLWKYCILAVLLFLAVEIALVRWMRG